MAVCLLPETARTTLLLISTRSGQYLTMWAFVIRLDKLFIYQDFKHSTLFRAIPHLKNLSRFVLNSHPPRVSGSYRSWQLSFMLFDWLTEWNFGQIISYINWWRGSVKADPQLHTANSTRVESSFFAASAAVSNQSSNLRLTSSNRTTQVGRGHFFHGKNFK